jgi:hypothetical protein
MQLSAIGCNEVVIGQNRLRRQLPLDDVIPGKVEFEEESGGKKNEGLGDYNYD